MSLTQLADISGDDHGKFIDFKNRESEGNPLFDLM
jgi:hypothetical protein